jgi:hypothetical protein
LLARIPKSFAGRRLGGICRAAINVGWHRTRLNGLDKDRF